VHGEIIKTFRSRIVISLLPFISCTVGHGLLDKKLAKATNGILVGPIIVIITGSYRNHDISINTAQIMNFDLSELTVNH